MLNTVDKIFIVGVLGVHLTLILTQIESGPWIFLAAGGLLIWVTNYRKPKYGNHIQLSMPRDLYEKQIGKEEQ